MPTHKELKGGREMQEQGLRTHFIQVDLHLMVLQALLDEGNERADWNPVGINVGLSNSALVLECEC